MRENKVRFTGIDDDRKSARKPRADEVVRGQCGLRSINLKRAAMPHVSF